MRLKLWRVLVWRLVSVPARWWQIQIEAVLRRRLETSSALLKAASPSMSVSHFVLNQRRRKDPPHPPVGGGAHAFSGASCCVGEPFWAHQNAKNLFVTGAPPRTPLGSLQRSPRPPSWWGEAPRGALLLPPQEPRLQYCHCGCPVCMYTRVWKCTVIFSWMLNTGASQLHVFGRGPPTI